MDLEDLDELEAEMSGYSDPIHLLHTVLRVQVAILRKVTEMADDIQTQIDAAFAGADSALAGLADRVAGIERGLTDEVMKLTDENKRLADELATVTGSLPKPTVDTTAIIAHLKHLSDLAEGIDAVLLSPPSGGGGGAIPPPGGPTGMGGSPPASATLDPSTGKPLYTHSDPQPTAADSVWPEASVEGSNGETLYTFNLDTSTNATGDGADGGIWHAYTGTTQPIGSGGSPAPGPGGTSPAGPPAGSAGATPGAPAGA